VNLPGELRRWLRIHAALSERDMGDIVAEALGTYRLKHKRRRNRPVCCVCSWSIDWVAVGALATLLAALVALFGDAAWRSWRRPMLGARIRRDDSGCYYKTNVEVRNASTGALHSTHDAYYFRLWILNDGRGPAEQAHVFASALARRDASGTFNPVAEFLPMGLLWTHLRPPSVFLPRLHSHMGHHCELGSVSQPDTPPRFELLVEAPPLTGWHRLEPGTYRLELRLACANGSPRSQTVDVHFTGRWFDDEAAMFRDGVVIRTLE